MDWSTHNEYIVCFGRNVAGDSVSVKIKGISFPFYISVSQWDQMKLQAVMGYLKRKQVKYTPVHRKIFDCLLSDDLQDKTFKFIRVDCKNIIDFYTWRKKFKHGFNTDSGFNVSPCNLFNAHIKPLLMFFHIHGFQANGWFNIYRYQTCAKFSSSDYDIEVDISNLNPIIDCKEKSRFRIASFDLETEGTDPHAIRKKNEQEQDTKVFQVGITFKELYNDESQQKVLLSLQECADIEGTIVKWYKTEKELIQGTIDTLLEYDFDILTGYNTFGFDNSFLFERAKIHGLGNEFRRLNRIPSRDDKILRDKMSGKGEGFQTQRIFNMAGRVQMDLLPIFRKSFKLDKYSLSFVSQTFLNDDKVDLPYQKMFELWNDGKGSPADLAIIGDYCVRFGRFCFA